MNILVFNWHEPYIHLFAKTGHKFYVSPPANDQNRYWNTNFRPIPVNAEEISYSRGAYLVDKGDIDLVLCLSTADLWATKDWKIPKIFVMLNMLNTDLQTWPRFKEDWLREIKPFFKDTKLVFISEKKRANWGWDAPVIKSAVDPEDYLQYTGERERVLIVGNRIKERAEMQGYDILQEVLPDFPHTILGVNPDIPNSKPSQHWDDLKYQYATHRCYLCTLNDKHEDGYNLAVLEAMATGMPIITIPNSSSPIIDGENGFISSSTRPITTCVSHLFDCPIDAKRLGKEARQTIKEQFPIQTFIQEWNSMFESTQETKENIPLDPYYKNERLEIVEMVPEDARRILDVGCATGEMLAKIKEKISGAYLAGIDKNLKAIEEADKKGFATYCIDLDSEEARLSIVNHKKYDCIICADSLEHLKEPQMVLDLLLTVLEENGCLILSIPNVRHYSVIIDLLINGVWAYKPEGILDRTHLRFYTRVEIAQMMQAHGLELEEIKTSRSLPTISLEPLYECISAYKGDVQAAKSELRIIQYIVKAKKKAIKKPIKASIIIPCHNKAELTVICLKALFETLPKNIQTEVIVIDNACTDNTLEVLASYGDKIQVISNEENLFFSPANNKAAKHAKGEYLIFLNNDTISEAGWLEALIETAEKDPQIAIVGAKLLDPLDRSIKHAGIEIENGNLVNISEGFSEYASIANIESISWAVTGACMLVRQEVFAELHGFSFLYKNGCEDVDLCLRAKKSGYKVIYQPKCVVLHYESMTEGRHKHTLDNIKHFEQQWPEYFESGEAPKKPLISWQGEFELLSSLSNVNLALIEALSKLGRYDIHKDVQGKQVTLKEDLTIRHYWPPGFYKAPHGKLIVMQPWEYGCIPSSWVEPINKNVDQIWAYTPYVKQCYINGGIEDEKKIKVLTLGFDPEVFNPEVPKWIEDDKFRFLFVGGTIYRKGIDILLKAFQEEFEGDKNILLVIKDMGVDSFYKGQTAEEEIGKTGENIRHIRLDINKGQMASLYRSCDCLVHPYRGEGFGLPVLEAMACGLPVIVTKGGACDWFVHENYGHFISSQRKEIELEQPTKIPPFIQEPLISDLRLLMCEIYENIEEVKERAKSGAAYVRETYTWKHTAEKASQYIEEVLG